jgi:hypothetical protein
MTEYVAAPLFWLFYVLNFWHEGYTNSQIRQDETRHDIGSWGRDY